MPIFFSWPSLNQLDPRAYVTDSDAAGAAAPDLANVLRTVRAAVGPSGEICIRTSAETDLVVDLNGGFIGENYKF